MTQNEKKVLIKFKAIKQANTVSMAGTLRVTISYACDVCKKLCESGYLEQLSPGRFALYKITSSGEEQVKSDVQTKEEVPIERRERVLQAGSIGRKVKVEKYECSNCGATVTEDEIECLECGIIFKGDMKEKETAEQSEEVLQPVLQGAGRSEKNVLDEPSVPEEWKTCNWKWK